jgi:hypothetical protein
MDAQCAHPYVVHGCISKNKYPTVEFDQRVNPNNKVNLANFSLLSLQKGVTDVFSLVHDNSRRVGMVTLPSDFAELRYCCYVINCGCCL